MPKPQQPKNAAIRVFPVYGAIALALCVVLGVFWQTIWIAVPVGLLAVVFVALDRRTRSRGAVADLGHEEHRKFEATLSSLTDGVAVFGADNRALIANPAMARMTGLPTEGFYLEELARLFRASGADIERALEVAVRRNEVQRLNDARLSVFTYNISVAPVLDADKVFLGAAVVLNDVTELQQLNSDLAANNVKLSASLAETELQSKKVALEKDKFQNLIHAIGDGVVAIDRAWNITLWNRAAEKLTGWTAAEVMGRPFRNHVTLLHESNRTENIRFLEDAMLKGETQTLGNHTVLIRKDGSEMPVGDSAAPIFTPSGDVDGVIVVFRDASPERQLERVKDDFLFSTVHDLRSPASIIKIGLAMIEEDKLMVDNAAAQKAFTYLTDANERLLKMIQNLLDGARKDRGGMNVDVSSIDIGEMIKKTMFDMQPLCIGAKVSCGYEEPGKLLLVSADKDKLREVLENLIGNAIKYNKPEGTLKVRHEVDGRFLKTYIEDTGIGVASENVSKLFTPYFREQQDTKVVGTGLGLYIVKKLVEIMGGSIEVTSVKGQGTTFMFSLLLAD